MKQYLVTETKGPLAILSERKELPRGAVPLTREQVEHIANLKEAILFEGEFGSGDVREAEAVYKAALDELFGEGE